MKKTDGIIFDLDGTLWDATESITEAWNDAYNSIGNNSLKREKKLTRADVMSCMGLLLPDIAAKLYPECTKEQQEIIMQAAMDIESTILLKGGVLYKNVKKVLMELKNEGYHLSVVSNCQAGYIETFIKAHSMENIFDDIECPGNTGLKKADNIKLVVERNNLKNPVYVGDTQSDADAAHKAGVPFVFASYGFGNVSDYEAEINSFEDVKKVLTLSL